MSLLGIMQENSSYINKTEQRTKGTKGLNTESELITWNKNRCVTDQNLWKQTSKGNTGTKQELNQNAMKNKLMHLNSPTYIS